MKVILVILAFALLTPGQTKQHKREPESPELIKLREEFIKATKEVQSQPRKAFGDSREER